MSAPSIPIISSVEAGDKQLTVYFIQQSDGGSAITKYQYSLNGSTPFTDINTTTSPLTITGLTNGTPYTVALKAYNGTLSGASDTTVEVTPYASGDNMTTFTVTVSMAYPSTVYLTATNAGGSTSDASSVEADFGPPPPIIRSIVPSDKQLSVYYTQENDGGEAITKYIYSVNGTERDASATDFPIVITDLSNGTPYLVSLKAVNIVGTSAATDASQTSIPFTNPLAPVITDVTEGLSSVQVAFSQGDNGGYEITSYKYALIVNGNASSYTTLAQTQSPLTITGLTPGDTYTVKLRAVTAVAESSDSNTSDSFVPYTYPSKPTSVIAEEGLSKLTVSFQAGATGYATIKYYSYSLNGGSYIPTPYTASPFEITDGIQPGTSYVVRLIANNNVDSSASDPAAAVIPYTYPSPPTNVTLTRGYKKVTVSFTPGADGYASIKHYKYSLDGTNYVTTAYTGSPFDISQNITPGQQYNVTLIANNNVDSSASTVSNTVIPYTNPSAPLVTSLIGGYEKLTVKFLQDSSGFADISGYIYSLNGGTPVTITNTTSPFDITTGILPGTEYKLTLVARHFVDSAVSNESNPAIPYTKPSAPNITRAVYDGTNLTITFTAPTNTGGVPIAKYSYAINEGTYVDYYKP